MAKSTRATDQTVAETVVHARAVGASAFIGVGLASVVGLLWVAVAFSSHESWAYSHMAWWLGATVIGASLIAGLAAGGLSSTRGLTAGAVNGATTGAIVVAVAGGIALLALAVNGSLDHGLLVNGHAVTVDFVRPYTAFWAAAGSLGLGAVGGTAGGLLPRRRASRPVVELAAVSGIRPESLNVSNGSKAPTAAGF